MGRRFHVSLVSPWLSAIKVAIACQEFYNVFSSQCLLFATGFEGSLTRLWVLTVVHSRLERPSSAVVLVFLTCSAIIRCAGILAQVLASLIVRHEADSRRSTTGGPRKIFSR